ncbi:MAG: YfhO family protein [Bacteroidales bacterium]|nr:YfhO family protein [Bacteroidales bacterium]
MKEFFKRFGVYIVAAVVFIVVAFAYCFPVLQGKVIYAGDNLNAECASHEAMEYARTTGDHTWWTGSMFCGMPDYQIGGGQYKTDNWLRPLTAIFHRGHAHTAWVFIIYFICFFALLRSFDVDKWLSIVGALAIAFSTYFIVIIAAGHNGKTSTIALISVVFAGFYLIFRKKYALGAIFAMVFTAIGFSTHPQMAYYIFMMIGLCLFGELYTHIREKRMKDFAVATLIFIASVGLGMGTSCSNVFANAEYTRETMRGGHSDLAKDDAAANTKGLDLDYATQWSYGKDETFSLLIPGFMGGASTMNIGKESDVYKTLISRGVTPQAAREFVEDAPMYWGDQPFTAGNVYVGAIICFLFILGLLIVKGPYKWTLLLATLFSICLAWGHNWMGLTEFFFKYFPLYNKFRAVSSILIVAEIAMPLLGFLALRELMQDGVDRKKMLAKVGIAGGITAALCLFFALFGTSLFDFKSIFDARLEAQMPDWLYSSLLDERASLLVRDSWRSFFFILAGVVVVILKLYGKLNNAAFAAALGVLMLLDLWPVDRRYLNESNFVPAYQESRYYNQTSWEKAILADPDPHFRVLNLTTNTFNDSRTSYRLKSIGGYSAAKLRRYQDLIDVYMSGQVDPEVISMLNAKYVINFDDKGNESVQMNPMAMGNAWFVERIKLVDTPDEEMAALQDIDLRSEAVVDRSFASFVPNPEIKGDPEAVIALTKYTPKQLDYKCVTQEPTTVIFSEIYYPYGWKAFIDGKLTPHFRANYTLRALNVPPGNHEITFLFDPDSVKKGDAIALTCVILMYLIIIGLAGTAVYKRLKRKNA